MKKEKLDLIHAALLHNLGRLIARAENRDNYSEELVKNWLEQNAPHWSDIDSQQKVRSEKIIHLANQMASGLDLDVSEVLSDHFKPLADIFNVFKEKRSHLYKPLTLSEDDQSLPESANLEGLLITQQDYKRILDKLVAILKEHSFSVESIPDLLHALEALCSFVPVSPGLEDFADINVSQHSLLTAGFAAAIWDYLEEHGDDWLDAFSQEKVFLLASFDVSGIQDFIYNISSGGAAKQLKARS